MKKLLFFAFSAALLCACSSHPALTELAVQGEPISPVYLSGDTTHLYLTDYVPSLDESDIARIEITDGLQLTPFVDGQLDIIGSTENIATLHISDGKHVIDVAVLPKSEYLAGAITSESTDGLTLTIRQNHGQEAHLVAFIQNKQLEDCISKESEDLWTVDLQKAVKQAPFARIGRTYLRIFGSDAQSRFNDILIPLQDGTPVTCTGDLNRHDAQAQVLYSMLVDRFCNGDTTNDAPLLRDDVDPRVDYQGGDFKGITAKINDGFFDDLGITTLWISPISQNPTTPWGHWLNPDTRFSGYHGYWPIYNTCIDNRFGDDASLKEMLATAHQHKMNVILDYVANHMHIESPTLQEHPDWITDSILPDGRRNFELWDEARLTTWFDVHIPTLDLEREEVCDHMTDTALYWIKNYDFDGYRHDACKHIPLNYWRMFTHKMKQAYPDRSLWMIGETYGDAALISSYVKTGMLNAQFDFNVYHTAIDVFGGRPHASMKRIAAVVADGQQTYGSHHTMGNISGNHDKPRFISLAGGAVAWDEDSKLAGWTRQIGVTADGDSTLESRAFKKALLLEVLNLTIPGVPCIYQGDEFGQAGANDPDNRRMMRFSGLNANEEHFRNEMIELIQLRRHSMPLLYGDYEERFCNDDVFVFTRTYMGETVVVAINNGNADWSCPNGCMTVPANGYVIKKK